MREISLIIRSAEWTEEAQIPFPVKEIQVIKHTDYPFTLQNKEGEEEVYPIPDCMVLQFNGEKEQMAIAISNSLIYTWNSDEVDKTEKLVFDLKPQRKVFEIGMSVGLYFDADTLPNAIKGFDIKMSEENEN